MGKGLAFSPRPRGFRDLLVTISIVLALQVSEVSAWYQYIATDNRSINLRVNDFNTQSCRTRHVTSSNPPEELAIGILNLKSSMQLKGLALYSGTTCKGRYTSHFNVFIKFYDNPEGIQIVDFTALDTKLFRRGWRSFKAINPDLLSEAVYRNDRETLNTQGKNFDKLFDEMNPGDMAYHPVIHDGKDLDNGAWPIIPNVVRFYELDGAYGEMDAYQQFKLKMGDALQGINPDRQLSNVQLIDRIKKQQIEQKALDEQPLFLRYDISKGRDPTQKQFGPYPWSEEPNISKKMGAFLSSINMPQGMGYLPSHGMQKEQIIPPNIPTGSDDTTRSTIPKSLSTSQQLSSWGALAQQLLLEQQRAYQNAQNSQNSQGPNMQPLTVRKKSKQEEESKEPESGSNSIVEAVSSPQQLADSPDVIELAEPLVDEPKIGSTTSLDHDIVISDDQLDADDFEAFLENKKQKTDNVLNEVPPPTKLHLADEVIIPKDEVSSDKISYPDEDFLNVNDEYGLGAVFKAFFEEENRRRGKPQEDS